MPGLKDTRPEPPDSTSPLVASWLPFEWIDMKVINMQEEEVEQEQEAEAEAEENAGEPEEEEVPEAPVRQNWYLANNVYL